MVDRQAYEDLERLRDLDIEPAEFTRETLLGALAAQLSKLAAVG